MIILDRGIKIRGLDLWLDATRSQPLSFISHAHQDHVARHQQAITSPSTANLLQKRDTGIKKIIRLNFHEPFQLNGVRIELFPAGHILGSAQILIENDHRIVYTGDFKLRSSRTAESVVFKPCDILIMESTFGRPHYIFPPVEESLNQLIHFIHEAFEQRAVPVLYAYALGKSQEVIKILGDSGYAVCIHPIVQQFTEVYQACGVRFHNLEPISGNHFYRKVLVLPPHLRRSRLVQRLHRKRTAMLTGWAVDQGAARRFGVDRAIPFSDHADFRELLTYVKRVQPRKVYTVHGFPELAAALRKIGFSATHLENNRQLRLWED